MCTSKVEHTYTSGMVDVCIRVVPEVQICRTELRYILHIVAVCCSVLQCVAVRISGESYRHCATFMYISMWYPRYAFDVLHVGRLQHMCVYIYIYVSIYICIQPIAFGVSFSLNFQSVDRISLVSAQRNVAKETQRTRSTIEI